MVSPYMAIKSESPDNVKVEPKELLLRDDTSASAECRHWSGRAVRWSSCAILLSKPGSSVASLLGKLLPDAGKLDQRRARAMTSGAKGWRWPHDPQRSGLAARQWWCIATRHDAVSL